MPTSTEVPGVQTTTPSSTTSCSSSNSSRLMDRHLKMSEEYQVEWTTDLETIFIRVTCKTLGFVGFGISPNGGMNGADIFIGGVDDSTGNAYFGVSVIFLMIE